MLHNSYSAEKKAQLFHMLVYDSQFRYRAMFPSFFT